MKRLILKLLRRWIREIMERTYQDGLSHGYRLGYHEGKIERFNRGYVLSVNIKQSAEDIMKEKGL